MAINTQIIRIDLNTGKTIPVAFAHQNDTNRQLTFQLYNNGVAFTPSSTTVKFAYKSPIVNGQYSVITGSQMASGTVSGNTVTVTLPAQYTQVSGVGLLTMILTTSGNTLRPVNIKFVCQGSADGDDTVLGASDWPEGLYDYMDNWLEENEPTEIANLKSDLLELQSGGYVADQQRIGEKINEWLDDHPEATTTVQDGAITEVKFADSLKLKAIKDYVTPQMFGAKGDGIADDTAAFQALNGKTAYIPEGTYIVSAVEYTSGTAIFGAGMGRTIIQQKTVASSDLLDFVDADSCILTNLTLNGNRNETSNDVYRALLKIRTTIKSPTKYSNFSVFEHLSITNAPSSGLVLLGRSSADPIHPNQHYNWVHQINDIRIEKCGAWCMIDETSDNRFSNLYLNEGDVGNLLCKSSYNMYSNLKLDQPYGSGNKGTLSGFNDGALLVCHTCVGNRYTNIDMQSACYVGAKMYNCRNVHIDGDINNIGLGADGNGIGLMIDNSSYCDITASFSWINVQQKRNVEIGSNCQHVSVNAIEFRKGTSENSNSSQETCYITDPSNASPVYNKKISKKYTMDNILTNALCQSLDGWNHSGNMVTLDTSGKVVGTNSFKITGNVDNTMMLTQTHNGLTPGDYYILLAVVVVEQTATVFGSQYLKAPYINFFDGSSDSREYTSHSVTPNEVGAHLICQIGKVGTSGELSPRFLNYKNDSISYIGNFMMCKLTDLGIVAPAITDNYDAVYNKLNAVKETAFNEITSDYDYTDIMGVLDYLLNKDST